MEGHSDELQHKGMRSQWIGLDNPYRQDLCPAGEQVVDEELKV